jgi:hypothetical protein
MTGAPSAWIENDEKYALVGLTVKFEGALPPGNLAANLSVLAGTTFSVPANWREWLGSIRAGEVEDCNLFLLSKMASTAPGVLGQRVAVDVIDGSKGPEAAGLRLI